jgi:diadenosine tetraphosphatase ApaH/serine/threonine PP2A family protein phosphatase
MVPVTATPISLPDELIVWAVSDVHGRRRELVQALMNAGLIDRDEAWAAPGCALVVIGDTIDRGPDPIGTIRWLGRLRASAAERGGTVALLEGNHEQAASMALNGGGFAAVRMWLAIGGVPTVLSCGVDTAGGDIAAAVNRAAPDLRGLLDSVAPYARWRDVCFAHAGLVPDVSLAAFAEEHDRVWNHGPFVWGPPFPDAPEWRSYHDAGITRVVVGHKVVERPTLEQGGHALMIDTGAGYDRPGSALTLVRLPDTGLDPVETIRVPIQPA